MLIVKIYGGLANQMFQYSLYKSLLHKKIEVYTDTISFIPSWGFDDVSLKNTFPNVSVNDAEVDLIKQFSSDRSILSRLRKFLGLHKKTHYFEPTYHYNLGVFALNSDYYIEGYWQTEKYFIDIQEEIRKDFIFKKFLDQKNIDLLNILENEVSVSIHVRKGLDYKKSITNGTCEIDYYNKAIDLIKEKVKNPRFFVFTDNKEWVKEMFTHFEYTLVDWNPVSGPSNYLDMQLMSHCKHNIIANSSYSWWGAWLNPSKEKVVIAPAKWYMGKLNDSTIDLIPPEWYRI